VSKPSDPVAAVRGARKPPGPTVGTDPRAGSSGSTVPIPRLEVVVEREAGQASRRTVHLEGDLFRIGSHPANELVIDDPRVSRFHCLVARETHGWKLLDAGSTNGTRLCGVGVRDANLDLPESRIELGDSTLVVREAGSVREAEVSPLPNFGAIFGVSVAMRQLFEVLRRVAKSDANVLLEGESGTGKELIAAELVQRGARANKPLVIVDCGAMSAGVIESELFGHAKGAFTGAIRDRAGAFELAGGGTVFLDEIGELPLELQPKLLRALAAREIRRIGDDKVRKVDVRVIAATNRSLEREVNQGRFREDLYYRLAVVNVRVPPLRERTGDIKLLIDAFLAGLEATEQAHLFPPSLLEQLVAREWPGNVRELKNFVERTIVLGGDDLLALGLEAPAVNAAGEAVADAASGAPDLSVSFRKAKDAAVTAFERRYLTALLEQANGNVSQAARLAGLERMYLHRLLQRHGLRRGASLGSGNTSASLPPDELS
jgi:transcriptional regulator with GAF, ATPase, and Fis domain